MVADSDVEEILLDECTDTGDIRVVRLLVEDRAAVTGEATRSTIRRGREEELGSTPLRAREGAVLPGQKAVEGGVPSDHSAQEGRLRAELGLVVHELRQVMRGVGLPGFLREGIAEQFHESRDFQKLRRLKVNHAVGVEEQERQVLLRRIVERVERARRGLRFPAEAAKEEAVAERETDQGRRLARHAVQLVEPAGREQGLRLRVVVEEGRRRDHSLAAAVDEDVGQGWERIDEHVTGEDGLGAQLGEDRLGPTAGEEVAVLVGVAAALAAAGEVEQLTGLARRLADMATATRSVLSLGIGDRLVIWIGGAQSAAEGRPGGQVKRLALVDVDACGPDGVVEEQLSEVALFLGCRVSRIHAPIRPPGNGNVGIRRRNHQLMDSTDLLVDEPAQVRGTLALRNGCSAANERNGQSTNHLLQDWKRS